MVGLSPIEFQCHSNLPVVKLCIICKQTCHEGYWHHEKIVFITICPLQLKSVHSNCNGHDCFIVWVIILWDFSVKLFEVKFNVIVFLLLNCILHTLSTLVLSGSHPLIENWHWFSVWFSMTIGNENCHENQTKGSHWRWEPPSENCPSSQLASNLRIRLVLTFREWSGSHAKKQKTKNK
jgi:hypothetical protein